MKLELESGTKIQSNCPGLIMMIMVLMVNNNVTGQYFESFVRVDLDQSISCVLFCALTEYRPLGGRYYSLSVKYIYAINRYN